MKFFIFTCFTIAHLLTRISARIRLTTPMHSAIFSNNDEFRQVSKYAEMIDFVNTVYNTENDEGRSFVRRHGPSKHEIIRRFEASMDAINRVAKVHQVRDEQTKAKFAKFTDTARYNIIDNPEILYDYRAKLKNKTTESTLDPVKASSDAKSFSIAEYKLNDSHSQMEAGAVLHDNAVITADPEVMSPNDPAVHFRAQDDVKDLTTVEVNYRPSFLDEVDDDETIMDGIDLTINEKEMNKPKTEEKDHGAPTEITNLEENEKRTMNNKVSGKVDKPKIDTKEIDSNDFKESGQMTTENRVTKFIDSQEKLNKDSIRSKDKDDKKKDSNMDENSEKEKNHKERSSDKYDKKLTSAERLISKIDNQINNDRIEQHLIYSLRERNVNRNKHFKESHEKKDKYVKKKDKNLDRRDEKQSQWIKIDNQKVHKENYGDMLDEKWNKKEKTNNKHSKKEKELDQNYDRLSKKDKVKDNNDGSRSEKEKNWDKNDDRSSEKEKNRDKHDDRLSKKDKTLNKHDGRWSEKEKDWDKNDDRLRKKEKYWNKMAKQRDHEVKGFDIMEYEWNKRHQEYDKNQNDAQYDKFDDEWDQKDTDWIDRDNEFKKRDNNWTERDTERNKKHDRTLTYNKNESDNKYSNEHVDKSRNVRHDRYKVVERNSRDSSGLGFG